MAEYRGKIDMLPTRESELVELTRDYTTLQQTYASLLQKREDSKLAANLERRAIGEQFKILDPASLPERPHNQKQRLAVLFGGPVARALSGPSACRRLEYRDSTSRTRRTSSVSCRCRCWASSRSWMVKAGHDRLVGKRDTPLVTLPDISDDRCKRSVSHAHPHTSRTCTKSSMGCVSSRSS